MATINLGRVRSVAKGAFSAVTAYNNLDWVTYNGGSYMCIQNGTPVGTLPTNTSYWQALCDQSAFLHLTGGTMSGDLTFSNGKKITDYLPLSGGTMSGTLRFSNGKTIADYVETAQGASAKGRVVVTDGSGNLTTIDGSMADVHNSIAGGRNLVSIFGSIANIEAAVAAGDFSNIFVGDYIPVTPFDAGYGTSDNKAYVMDIDGYMNIGDSGMSSHHLIMSMSCGSRKMNDTNITTGGYKGCKVHTEAMPAIQTRLETIFGTAHILTAKVLMTNTVSDSTPSMAGAGFNGASTGWEWVTTKCWLPNEVNVYGAAILSSSFYDNGGFPKQLALYRHKEHVKLWGRSYFWLSCVALAGNFCFAANIGFAYCSGAADYSLPLRPLFLLG